ncbi:MAG: ABC transporter substrate binding protein [Isosphaeraceae bacterium]
MQTARSSIRGRFLLVMLGAGLLTLSACGIESTTPLPGPTTAKKATSAKLIPGGVATIAVIRLNDPLTAEEPSNKDIEAGINQSGVASTAFKLVDFDAEGKLAAVPDLIAKARATKPDLLLTLCAETTLAALPSADEKCPLIFSLMGDPSVLGLGKNDADHAPHVTGAYSPLSTALPAKVAQGCQPKAKKFGILFTSAQPVSAAHKEALRRAQWDDIEALTADYKDPAGIPAAVESLAKQGAEAVFLCAGIAGNTKAAVDAATKARIPVYGFLPKQPEEGVMLARTLVTRWNGFEAGRRAGRVLLGEPPAQITFVRGDNYTTYINQGVAASLKITLLGALMRDARIVDAKAK